MKRIRVWMGLLLGISFLYVMLTLTSGCPAFGWVQGSLRAVPLSGSAPLSVLFQMDIGKTVKDGVYTWNFDDGTAIETDSETLIHSFESVGSFNVSCELVSDHFYKAYKLIEVNEVYNSDELLALINELSPTECPYPQKDVYPVEFVSNVYGGVRPFEYSWDFGDGTAPASSTHPTHNYQILANEENYSVQLTVHDGEGKSAYSNELYIQVCSSELDLTAHIWVQVEPSNCPWPESEVYTVTFACNVSGGKEPYSYSWDFGDGTAHSTEANPTHYYLIQSMAQIYSVQLTVQDDDGNADSSNFLEVAVCGQN